LVSCDYTSLMNIEYVYYCHEGCFVFISQWNNLEKLSMNFFEELDVLTKQNRQNFGV